MTAGAPVDERRQVVRERHADEPSGEVEGHCRRREIGQGQDVTPFVLLELLGDLRQGMRAGEGPHRSIRRQYQQPCGITPARDVRDPLEGRGVAPLKIFECEDQRTFGGQTLHRVGELP
jgi:hypothetical protein